MDKQVRARFSDAIYQMVLERFAIDQARVILLDGFESFVYSFTRAEATQDGQDFILRVGHSDRRRESYVLGEVDWLNYLAQHGARVARAVPSAAGNYVEAIDDGHGAAFMAATFVAAKGVPPWELDGGWTPARMEHYGEVIGRLHALSCTYQPRDPRAERPQWDTPDMQDAPINLPPSESVALAKHYAAYEKAMQLPRPADAFGLIHFDAHSANMLIDDQDHITLFDFDDCCYSWFANDIAMVLFYMVWSKPDPAAATVDFLTHFFRGYRREYQLDPMWLEAIPTFMKLREIDIYGAIHRSMDVDDLEDEWVSRYMAGRKERIEGDVPMVDLDFATLAPLLA